MPAPLARVGRRRTPYVAIWLVVALIAVLALTLPIGTLARATTTMTLLVFAAVNLALLVLGSREKEGPLRRRRWVGALGLVLTASLAIREILSLLGII